MATDYAASDRPVKKRRFFVEDSPDKNAAPDGGLATLQSPLGDRGSAAPHYQSNNGLRTLADFGDAITGVVGERLPDATLKTLHDVSNGKPEVAINMYFDGSWKTQTGSQTASRSPVNMSQFARPSSGPGMLSKPNGKQMKDSATRSPSPPRKLTRMPEKRYIGSLGVVGWATKSGSGLIKANEPVAIERAKAQIPKKARANNKRQDVIVRFTNLKGEEIGRLEHESAAWISALLDQSVCIFEGHCIYAPDRLRTNDNVYLQLRCFFVRRVFEQGNFIKPTDNNRQTGIFEARETEEERKLRTRQVGLVKLFTEINMHPTKLNESAEKHRREGILQAAEMAEKSEKAAPKPESATSDNGGTTPPSDEQEDGQELQQDQLDSLYKKAQSFDFDTPELQPASTFVMDLRRYQKQALHWMVSKERDIQSRPTEAAMHPLWEEYEWPQKDAEDKALPAVEDQNKFYINPYSGELSLDFPVQEQNCLGGVLADGMCPDLIDRPPLIVRRDGTGQNDRNAQLDSHQYVRIWPRRIVFCCGICDGLATASQENDSRRMGALHNVGHCANVTPRAMGKRSRKGI